MYHNIIANLYPHGAGNVGERSSRIIKLNPRHTPPRLQPIRNRHKRRRRDRESTEPPENPGASPLLYLPSLEIRFNDVPRTDKGLIFGSNPNCDVVLDIQGVSNIHFSLTFDGFNRLIVSDLNSFLGTQVTYNGDGEGVRRNFRWIIGGHDIPQQAETIFITLPDVVSFQIVVHPHDINSPAYVDCVRCFNRGKATTEALLNDLGLSNPPTRPRTGTHTPGTGAIHLLKRLGAGSHGIATLSWNVSTGDECVIKKPSRKAILRGKLNRDAWKLEANIMGQVSHPHIVKLIKSFSDPQPELHLEYVPCGCLSDHEDISYNEISTIMRQCLSALVYLHEKKPPITHRDIKPDNIFVKSRSKDVIHVKLGDFGISRRGFELSTICGTYDYMAPEVHSDVQRYRNKKDRLVYTTAVDIWSLGVVAFELLYGLPHYATKYNGNGVAWCKNVCKELQRKVQTQPTALGSMVLSCMVVLPHGSRSCARECSDELEDLPTTEWNSFNTSTVAWQPRSEEATDSLHIGRLDAPPPESQRMAQQYNEPAEPSLSAIPYHKENELNHFMQCYSADNAFNPLYVGSLLASEFEGNSSEYWGNQFPHESSRYSLAGPASPQAGRGSGTTRPITPRAEKGESYLPSGTRTVEEGNMLDAEEMAGAALLLQAIGQCSRASSAHQDVL